MVSETTLNKDVNISTEDYDGDIVKCCVHLMMSMET